MENKLKKTTKLKSNSKKITSKLAGIVPIYEFMCKNGFDKVISAVMGKRPAQSTFQNTDIIKSWIMTVQCFGYRLFRIEEAKEDLSFIPKLKICGHDTVGRFFKRLCTKNKTIRYRNKKRKKTFFREYTINENPLLIDLLIKLTKSTGFLNEKEEYTLDLDSTPLYSGTKESKWIYKGDYGYNSMVGIINQAVVYTDMRDGKSSPEFRKQESLQKCLEALEANKIKVTRIRIDGAGYSKDVTNYIVSKGLQFIIGADWSERGYELLKGATKWEKNKLETYEHTWNAEFCSFPFHFAKENNVYRMITVRVSKDERKNNKKIAKWVLRDGYFYKFILTNDETKSAFEITKEYHKRGGFERNFDYLKNDFGWKILPFSKLNQNLVYIIMCAISNNIYRAFLKFGTKILKNIIKVTYRLDTFFRKFIKGNLAIINGKYDFSEAEIPYGKVM